MGYPFGVMGGAAKCRRVSRCDSRRVEMTSVQGVCGRVFWGSHCGMGRWNRGGFLVAYLRASAGHAVLGSRDPSVTRVKVLGWGCWSNCLWRRSAHFVRQMGHGDWSPARSHAGLLWWPRMLLRWMMGGCSSKKAVGGSLQGAWGAGRIDGRWRA